jgi:hypothetical protein
MFTKRRPIEDRFWEKVKKTKTCWLWTGAKSTRYGYGGLSTERGEHPKLAHRFSYELHKGPIPQGKFIMHSCDKALCVNPAHLSAGTQKDNMLDAVSKRRMRHGENHPMARFTLVQVMAIRKVYSMGISQSLIERILSVPQRTINDIIHRRTWKYC